MQAILLSEFGPPEVLVPSEVPEPAVGPGQVLIDVELANITFVETQVRSGKAPNPAMLPELPTIPGNGVGGVVAAVGDEVGAGLVGARVVASTDWSGAYAEKVTVPAEGLIDVPDRVSMADAVALLADGRTATLLARAAGLTAGESVLVEAAAGGVGSLLVQLACNAGAQVVAVAGEDRKLKLARELGAELTVNYRQPDWADQVRTELGSGVDVAFDGVGGTIGRASFELVQPGGRFVPFGMASGQFSAIPEKEASDRGVTVVQTARPTPAEMLELTRAALAEAEAGRLRPVIGQRFPLAEAARAHAAIEARETVGKTLLVVGEEPAELGMAAR